MSNYKRYVFAFFICHPLNNPLASIKMVKKSGRNLHFSASIFAHFLLQNRYILWLYPFIFCFDHYSSSLLSFPHAPLRKHIHRLPSKKLGTCDLPDDTGSQPTFRTEPHATPYGAHPNTSGLCFSSSYPCLFQRPKYLTALL